MLSDIPIPTIILVIKSIIIITIIIFQTELRFIFVLRFNFRLLVALFSPDLSNYISKRLILVRIFVV